MKRILLISLCFLFLAACVFSYLAGSGMLADQARIPEQNKFGGIGNICKIDNPGISYAQDNTRLYYSGFSSMWNEGVHELCWYDPASDTAGKVCSKPSCSHKTADCPLYLMYQAQEGFNFSLTVVDHEQFYASYTKDKMLVCSWNPLTDEKQTVLTLPRYLERNDSAGMEASEESYFETAVRINEDEYLILCNHSAYLVDNQYNVVSVFPLNSLNNFTRTAHAVFWSDVGGMNCYYPETGQLKSNVLQELLHCNYQYCADGFGYGNLLYFVYDSAVRTYDPESRTVRAVTNADSDRDTKQGVCRRIGSDMYYYLNGNVHRMNLQTKADEEMPEMPELPLTELNGFLIVSSGEMPKGLPSDFLRFYLNGKAVTA